MKSYRVTARALHQGAAVAPLIGAAATVYGLYHTFNSLGASDLTWQTVAGGIAHSLAATAVLLVSVPLVAALYSFIRGRGDDNGAA